MAKFNVMHISNGKCFSDENEFRVIAESGEDFTEHYVENAMLEHGRFADKEEDGSYTISVVDFERLIARATEEDGCWAEVYTDYE